MKKFLSALLVCVLVMTAGIASAHGVHGHQAEKKPSVLVNGVEVKSKANHLHNQKYYVSVEAFADLFGQSFELSSDKKTVMFNGKTIHDIRMATGEPTAWIRELGYAVDAQSISWDEETQEVYVLVLPKGTIQLEPFVVPAMGEHWANPAELPLGPIYGVYNGRLVFLEYMISLEDFKNGKSYTDVPGMKGMPSPSVVQTDVEFVPHGHPGFEVPHFDIHAYFISDEEQHKIGTVFVDLLNDKSENIGFAAFYQMGEDVFLKVSASGLTPGKHGFHIHEKAITDGDFMTAGGHFNPEGKKHGKDNPEGAHAGDLPNLEVNDQGSVNAMFFLKSLSLDRGKSNSIYGKSIIIHANEDDGMTDPSGNSGDRVAGGNIPE